MMSEHADQREFDAEIVIGVHNGSRPVERAVSSVLRNTSRVRATVVAHNHPRVAVLERLGTLAEDPRVQVLELHDGVRSPANPYNFALERSSAEFVGVLGSDDELAAGALDAWLAIAHRDAADVVIAPIWRVNTGAVPAPRVRARRKSELDGDRDRLFERTAPLGIWRRTTFQSLRFLEGLPRGIDHEFGLELWFSGRNISFDASTPPYLEHDDQSDRVTKVAGTAADDFAYLEVLLTSEVFDRMGSRARRAVVAKIIRSHVVGSVFARASRDGLSQEDRRALRAVVRRLRESAPDVDRILARRDGFLLRRVLEEQGTGEWIASQLSTRGRYARFDAVVPGSILYALHRHAPLRSLIAGRRIAREVASHRR